MLTTLGRFIRAIAAVNVMITHEVFGNTLIILTLELRVITGLIENLRERIKRYIEINSKK